MEYGIVTNYKVAYINPHTCQLTSDRENTRVEEWEREAVNAGFAKLTPPDPLGRSKLNLPNRTYIDSKNNSANLAVGTKIHLKGGEYITLAEDGFDLSGRKVEERYFLENSDIRDCFNFLLNHTSGTRSSLFRTECYDKWLELIPDVLDLIGVDASKDFTLNGMKFTRDEDGNIVSQKMIDAQIAFEQQVARSLTYKQGDDSTIQTIAYRTNYYFRTAPDNVKKAWEETLEETNLNPFATTYGSTIAQIAMEQDFVTGGNNQLFSDSVENSIESVKKIIERIDNPLGVLPKSDKRYQKDAEFTKKERAFYMTFLSKLKKMI